jgi:hypothetical protein
MPSTDSKREKAREVVDILEEISMLLVRQSNTFEAVPADTVVEHSAGPDSIVSMRLLDREWR